MSGSEASHTITSAPYALPLPLDAPGGAQQASAGSAAVKEEVIANGSIVPPTAAVKRKLDPQEEAKLREVEYKKRVNQAATLDRMRALQPDYETPFNYPNDALQRLLCYHVFTSSQVTTDPKVDEDEWKKEFNSKAIECSARLEKIKAQYEKHLLRAPSQPKEEKILLNKLSYFDEKFEVESLKTKLGIPAKPAAITPMARTAPSPMTPSSMPRPSMASPPPRVVSTAVPSMAKPSVAASPHSVAPSSAPKPAAAASAAASAALAHAASHAAHSAQAPHAAHSAQTTHTAHVPASHARMGPAAHAAAHAASAPAPAPTPLPLPTHSAPAPAPAPVVAVVQTSSDGAPVIVLASTR